jgi:hypothetical protein
LVEASGAFGATSKGVSNVVVYCMGEVRRSDGVA